MCIYITIPCHMFTYVWLWFHLLNTNWQFDFSCMTNLHSFFCIEINLDCWLIFLSSKIYDSGTPHSMIRERRTENFSTLTKLSTLSIRSDKYHLELTHISRIRTRVMIYSLTILTFSNWARSYRWNYLNLCHPKRTIIMET